MKRLLHLLLLLLWPVIGRTQSTPYEWHLPIGSAVAPPGGGPNMAYDTVRRVTLCIPSNGDTGDFPGMWKWDGTDWTPPTDASSTERRRPVRMVFDSVRGVAVLYCERPDSDPLKGGFTWEWDGTNWRLASTNGPTNRDNMGMAFDSHRGRVVVFGGNYGFVGPLPAWTWEWDGNAWRVVATNGPSRRINCVMAYDAQRRVTMLFGGRGGITEESPLLRDTWTWDGTDWTPVSVAGPTGRTGHAMVYDTVRERVLLYGGWNDGNLPNFEEGLGDLWEWDGSQWLPSTPGPRHYSHAMACDSRRGEVVVFGGGRNRDFELRETWLLKLHETWVDFGFFGGETGTFANPYNTIGEAASAAPPVSALKIKAGSSAERLTISKRLIVQAFGGPVTIGQ